MKQVARFVIGNPGQSDFNTLDIVKSSENSPIVSFHEFGNSSIDYDFAGNIFYKKINKIISDIQEIQSKIVNKSEEIEQDSIVSALNMILNIVEELAITVKNFEVVSEKVAFSADKVELNSEEILLGTPANIEFSEETKDDDYNHDAVLVLKKYIYFYNQQIIPFINKLVEKFDTHIHDDPVSGVTGLPVASFKLGSLQETTDIKNIDNLKASTTTKAL